jgi:hypothetical protein
MSGNGYSFAAKGLVSAVAQYNAVFCVLSATSALSGKFSAHYNTTRLVRGGQAISS